jgi:hypothetical protein
MPFHVWNKKSEKWGCCLDARDERIKDIDGPRIWFADTEADARAKMLIYLVESGFITL